MTAPLFERRSAVARLLAGRRDLLVVSGLGAPTYDVAAAGDHERNFHLWGAMGSAALVGLGLALAQPSVPVLVVTGDGEMLMGLGSLATIGVQRPANLSVVVIDNERYGETGMQATHTASGVDLAAVARACGFPNASTLTREAEIAALRAAVHAQPGPNFATVKVVAEKVPIILPPRDGGLLKARFRRALLGEAADTQ